MTNLLILTKKNTLKYVYNFVMKRKFKKS